MKEITVAVTGASGSACAARLLHELAAHPDVARVNAVMSSSALIVAREEIGPAEASGETMRIALAGTGDKVVWYNETDLRAPMASGSHLVDGTCIIPCSTGTLGVIASGASRSLIHRAAEVTLKERRLLVLGVREAPLSTIHLENMLRVSKAGAIILPITPAFYSHPRSIQDIVEQYVGRVLDLLGLRHRLGRRWEG
ncbi:MAG TPA: UbiX family flavin prenyltransferase [Candidatus Polarisedimenticolia bacterium]|nr:UbiX family flavin prenyltransferase [Candidatus Polarisedimenticolia bacterium]